MRILPEVKELLDLRGIYKATEQYCGTEGPQSIDPAVFFKLMLIGYLENLLGIITAVGGGVLQDVLLNRIPTILKREIYASAALIGASIVAFSDEWLHWASQTSVFSW